MDSRSTIVYDCSILKLPKIESKAGNLTYLENYKTIPFKIKRVYYLYDVPGGEVRGGHAHKSLYQLLIAAEGSFDVYLNDGVNKKKHSLNRSYLGLLLLPGLWREIINFSSGAICLVFASEYYDKEDYIYEYETFLKYKK